MSSPALMNASLLRAYDEPLTLTDVPVPAVPQGHVLVEVQASGVNPLDTKIRTGAAGQAKSTPPAILGIDLAGTVVAVADDVSEFKVGDRVYGMTGGVGGVAGSLAEYASVDARLIAKTPDVWSSRQAAAVPLSIITAWEALVDRAVVGPGHQVLIHGGAGGVGHFAVQLARARGAGVYATGSAQNRASEHPPSRSCGGNASTRPWRPPRSGERDGLRHLHGLLSIATRSTCQHELPRGLGCAD